MNFSRIRAVGDRIRNGEVMHTGVIPFLKMFESTTKSCTQNGIRGGSSTTHFPWWHREILDVLVLKNNKGTDDNRVCFLKMLPRCGIHITNTVSQNMIFILTMMI